MPGSADAIEGEGRSYQGRNQHHPEVHHTKIGRQPLNAMANLDAIIPHTCRPNAACGCFVSCGIYGSKRHCCLTSERLENLADCDHDLLETHDAVHLNQTLLCLYTTVQKK